jgi:hypothetical protein
MKNAKVQLKQWIARHTPRRSAAPLIKLSASLINQYSLDNVAHEIFRDAGFHLLRHHYYLPIPSAEDLDRAFASGPSQLVGVDMNDAGALNLLEDVFPALAEEFRNIFPLHGDHKKRGFYLINGSFMAIDAQVYFAFIRHFRPKRIVEIGAGNSTLVAAEACSRNAQQYGQSPELTAIDPYPPATLKGDVPGLSKLIESSVQDVGLDVFMELEAGDILFIDSTHVLREGGDVQLEYCEILPRLAPGVLVHIHDISLPKPYPRVYFDQRMYWNEQYVLQTFLAFNARFEVVWAGNYNIMKYPQKVCAVFPEYYAMREAFPQSEPSSFWIRVRQ